MPKAVPNYFQRDTLRPYTPTPRDRMANWFVRSFGDNRFAADMSRRFLGSDGTGNTGMGVIDLIPGLGTALQLDEAGAQMTGGHPLAGAASAAMAAVPVAGPAMKAGARKVGGMIGKAGQRAIAEIAPKAEGFVAYHGSPHTFDQFDASKIGTGEGAQAYGHGLYFAENEGVAKSYRDNLSGYKVAGNDPSDGEAYAIQALQAANGDPRKALALHQREKAANPGWDFPEGAATLRSWAEHGVPDIQSPGSMYQVRINADPNDFLDWDKPLSEQSADVQRKLMNHPQAHKFSPDAQGASLYESQRLVPGDFTDKPQASRELQGLGIPGIKYLDQGSRGAGDGSRNFVVFDPRIVDIMKRYGVAAPVAAAMFAGQIPYPDRK